MSYSYALPGERFSSGLSRRWLIACTLSQLVCVATLTAAAIVAQRLQWRTGSIEMIGLHLGTAAVFALTYGSWRGLVLRSGLARFPMPLWCLAAGAIALIFTPPVPKIVPDLEMSRAASVIVRALLPVALNGLFYGLVVGGVEALVMRRAAYGLAGWVMSSGLAFAFALTTTTIGITLTSAWLAPALGSAGVTALWSCLMAPLAALPMLPALRNLTPQLSYYGPRAYRPFFFDRPRS